MSCIYKLEMSLAHYLAIDLGIIVNYTKENSLKENMACLGAMYATYATTLSNRDKMIECFDVSVWLSPNGALPLEAKFSKRIQLWSLENEGVRLSDERKLSHYKIPEDEKERLLLIFETRKGKINSY